MKDLVRRIKMLEFALKQERLAFSSVIAGVVFLMTPHAPNYC